MSERDHGERAGVGPGPRRPSRRMRERADEMADMLAIAAPSVRERRRRRSAAIPAAVAALGALTVGGVGVAVNLDARAADAEITQPAVPPAPGSDAGSAPDPEPRVTTSAVADVPLAEGAVSDDAERPRAAARPPASPGSARVRAPSTADTTDRGPQRPRATPTTRTGDDDESPREATPSRSTTTSPTSTRSDDADPRDDAPDDRGRPGRSGADGSPDLRADSRGTGAVLPSPSPTGDDE